MIHFLAYMAPEVLLRDNYTHKADVFSFGIVLYELFSGLNLLLLRVLFDECARAQ